MQPDRRGNHVRLAGQRTARSSADGGLVSTPGMRIYFAGASGAIGSRLLPMLVAAGHTVGAMTRSAEKAGRLASAGAQPIVCDVFDRSALTRAVRAFAPDLLLHELTDLPDDLENLPRQSLLNARIRTEGLASGVVLRYGFLYGPGTYFETHLPPAPARARPRRRGSNPPGTRRTTGHTEDRRRLAAQQPVIVESDRRT